MATEAEDPPPEAGKLPTGRIARTARVGGLVTGQGVRRAGMRTANRVRSPERAAAAQSERTAALVNQLVEQLGAVEPGTAADVEDPLAGRGGRSGAHEAAPAHRVTGLVERLQLLTRLLIERELAH